MTPGWPRPVSTLANARSGWPTACEVPPRWARAQLAISTMVLALWITLAVGEGGWLSWLLVAVYTPAGAPARRVRGRA